MSNVQIVEVKFLPLPFDLKAPRSADKTYHYFCDVFNPRSVGVMIASLVENIAEELSDGDEDGTMLEEYAWYITESFLLALSKRRPGFSRETMQHILKKMAIASFLGGIVGDDDESDTRVGGTA